MAEAKGKKIVEKPVENQGEKPSLERLKRKAGELKELKLKKAEEKAVEKAAEKAVEEKKAFKGLQESLYESKDRVARIVALISEVTDIDREKDDSANDVKELRKKLDSGALAKFSFLQLMDKNKLKIDGLNQEKKELLKAVNNEMSELRKALTALKDIQGLRAEIEGIGKLE